VGGSELNVGKDDDSWWAWELCGSEIWSFGCYVDVYLERVTGYVVRGSGVNGVSRRLFFGQRITHQCGFPPR